MRQVLYGNVAQIVAGPWPGQRHGMQPPDVLQQERVWLKFKHRPDEMEQQRASRVSCAPSAPEDAEWLARGTPSDQWEWPRNTPSSQNKIFSIKPFNPSRNDRKARAILLNGVYCRSINLVGDNRTEPRSIQPEIKPHRSREKRDIRN